MPTVAYAVVRLSQLTVDTYRGESAKEIRRIVQKAFEAPTLEFYRDLCADIKLCMCVDASFASSKNASS